MGTVTARASRGLLFGAALLLVAALMGGAVWTSVPKHAEETKDLGASALVDNPDSDDWRVREDAQSAYTISGEVTPSPAVAPADAPTYYDDGCQIQPGDSEVDPTCVYGTADGKKTIAMLGDSKMGQWFPAVAAIADSEGWRLELYLKSSCTFTYDGGKSDCNEFGKNVMDHFESEGGPDIALVSQGSKSSPKLRTGMAGAVKDLKAQGTEIIVMADSPRPDGGQVYTCVEEHSTDYSVCAFPADENNGRKGTGTEALETVAREIRTPVVDLNEWICPPGKECPPVIGDTLVYRQGSHVTASYIRTLTPMLYRELAARDLTSRDSAEIAVDDVP